MCQTWQSALLLACCQQRRMTGFICVSHTLGGHISAAQSCVLNSKRVHDKHGQQVALIKLLAHLQDLAQDEVCL
jgi:hypothetical protein